MLASASAVNARVAFLAKPDAYRKRGLTALLLRDRALATIA